jgi:hypothetical protein
VITVAALVTVALGASCSSGGGKSSSTTTRNEARFDIATPDGTASVSLNGKLPPGWPSGFPIPTDAVVAGSGMIGLPSSTTLVAAYTVSGDASATYDFYKTNTAFHITSSSSAGIGSAFVGSIEFDGAFTGSVTLAGRNSKTYLAIVLKTSADVTTTTGVGETTTTIAGAETTTTGIVS